MADRQPELGHCRLISDDPKRDVLFKLGENAPTVVSQYAQWALVPRPRKVSMTDWQGREPLAIRLELLSDVWDTEGSDVSNKRHALEIMAGLDDDPTEPPMIQWYANTDHDNGDTSGRLWYIEEIQWGRFWFRGGLLKRFTATVQLRHYVADEYLERNGAKKNKRKKKQRKKENQKNKQKSKKRSVVVGRAEEGLGMIAARELGHHGRWTEIAELNGIRDPNNIYEGQILRLP